MIERNYLTVVQAAAYLNVSKDIVYEGVKSGGLKHVGIGRGRNFRFRRDWLDAWMEKQARVNAA